MPPSTRSQAAASLASTKNSKGEAPEKGQETDGSEHLQAPKKDGDTKLPYEYYCIARPQFDLELENNEKEEDEQLDEEELEELFEKLSDPKNGVVNTPAANHPDHSWIAMWKTWQLECKWNRLATYCQPEHFNMYLYNDFNGYGLQELVENFLVAFNDEITKPEKTETSIKDMWATIAALAHWLTNEEMQTWIGLDDGFRVQKTVDLIGCAFLEALNELDLVGVLKPNSQVKDLELVMSLYLYWAHDLEQFGFENEDFEWQKHVLEYVKRAEINLEGSGLYSIRETLKSYEEQYGEITALKGAAKSDKWKWKKALKSYTKSYGSRGKIGGEQFNIVKFSRRERAKHAFNKKDPLADISDADLKEMVLFIS